MSDFLLISVSNMVKLLKDKTKGIIKQDQRGSHIRVEHIYGSKITISNHKYLKKHYKKIIKNANLLVDKYIKLVKKQY